jgi:hypothetical protein
MNSRQRRAQRRMMKRLGIGSPTREERRRVAPSQAPNTITANARRLTRLLLKPINILVLVGGLLGLVVASYTIVPDLDIERDVSLDKADPL